MVLLQPSQLSARSHIQPSGGPLCRWSKKQMPVCGFLRPLRGTACFSDLISLHSPSHLQIPRCVGSGPNPATLLLLFLSAGNVQVFFPPISTWRLPSLIPAEAPSLSALPYLRHSCRQDQAVVISTRASLFSRPPPHLEEELPDGGDSIVFCFSHLQPGLVHSRRLTFVNCFHEGNGLRLDTGTAGTLRPSAEVAVT